MKELHNNLNISYRWWRIDGEEIQECDVAELNTKAIDIILFQMQQGYVEGEMNAVIESIKTSPYLVSVCTSNSMIDIHYYGYWKKE